MVLIEWDGVCEGVSEVMSGPGLDRFKVVWTRGTHGT